MSSNTTTIVGNVTAEPELKFSNNDNKTKQSYVEYKWKKCGLLIALFVV